MDSLWTLVKDLNRARYNKQALDASIAEETAGVAFLEEINERLEEAFLRQLRGAPHRSELTTSPDQAASETRRSSRATPFDQVAAIQTIEAYTSRINADIEGMRRVPRSGNNGTVASEALEDALQARTQLLSELSSVVGRREAELLLGSGREVPPARSFDGSHDATAAEITALQEHIESKRQSCRKWIGEVEELRQRAAEVERENTILEQECLALERDSHMTEEKVVVLKEITLLEKSIGTLTNLISVPPATLRLPLPTCTTKS